MRKQINRCTAIRPYTDPLLKLHCPENHRSQKQAHKHRLHAERTRAICSRVVSDSAASNHLFETSSLSRPALSERSARNTSGGAIACQQFSRSRSFSSDARLRRGSSGLCNEGPADALWLDGIPAADLLDAVTAFPHLLDQSVRQ